METKVYGNVAASVLNILGYYSYVIVSSFGTKRGLALSWRAGCPLSFVCKYMNAIHVVYYPNNPHSAFLCSFVYGPP